MKKNFCFILIFINFSFIFSQLYQTETVYVYAKRIKENLNTLSLPITIIDQLTLKIFPTIEKKNILNYFSGINLNSYSFFKGLTGVSLQGNPKSSHTLILFDNLPLNQPSSQTTDLGLLPSGLIQKIEIYKGPNSNIYGTNALNGVINFIPIIEDKPLSLNFSYGSFKTYQLIAKTGFKIKDFLFSLNWEQFKTNGMRTNDGQKFYNFTILTKLSELFKLNSGVSLREIGVPGPKPNPNFIPPFGDSLSYSKIDRQRDTFYFLSLHFLPHLENIIFFNYQIYATYQRTNFASYETTSLKNNSYGSNLIISYPFGKENNFNFGLDIKWEKVKYINSSAFQAFRTPFALFSNVKYRIFERLFINGGIRVDDYEFGRFLSYSVGSLYSVNNHFLKFHLGNSFKAPAINDLYWPKTEIFPNFYLSGNQNLKREIANVLEINYQVSYEKYQISINPFVKKIKDLIRWTLDKTMTKYTPFNLDKSFIYGTEISFRLKFTDVEIGFNTTLLNGNEEIKEDTIFKKRKLTYVPKLTNSFYFYYSPLQTFNISLITYYRTEKINYYGKEIKILPSYFTLDLKANYQLTKFLNAEIAILNLFDKEYAEMFGYTPEDFDYPIGRRKIFLSLGLQLF
ncbi:MAG: TonB-dependent receptor [candidate division WOR-3 bacterium]|nr:TonB-dependent receptor [candidate division WOR-3 bacterium]MCX7836340.1 TonB-dependent receptor [candidate division WOR-3 bacterium]MDW8113555.1 TonB-dependent receptor [candidate division WOR-3 bacterium]